MAERRLKIIIDQTGDAAANLTKMVGVVGGLYLVKSALDAVGGAIADSVGKSAELQAQMSTIGARAGATAEEVGELKDLVSDLALDPKLKVSAFEAAEAIEELAAGGVAIDDIMAGAAEGTVALANAVGGDFGQAAEVAASSMSIFGIEAENMTDVVDGVTAVVVASKFDLNDYALALAQAGGAAATSGVEMEDFNTAIAAISPLFASGSDAGTSFKVFLQRLVADTKPAKTAMQELGLITADGANQFFDAQGNLKDMSEIAGLLQGSLSGLSEQQRNQALQTIFGTDAMRAAVGLMQTGGQGFRELQAAMSETSGAQAAAMMMDNLSGDSEILRGVIEGLQISYGDKLNPRLREFTQFATEYLSANGPAFVQNLADLSVKALDFAQAALPLVISEMERLKETTGPDLERIQASLGRLFGTESINGAQLLASAVDGIATAIEKLADSLETAERLGAIFGQLGGFGGVNALAANAAGGGALAPSPASTNLTTQIQEARQMRGVTEPGFQLTALGEMIVNAFRSAPPPQVTVEATLDGNQIAQSVSIRQGEAARGLARVGGPATLR